MSAVTSKADLAEWQEHLDYLLPRKPMLRPDEVSIGFGIDPRTIARLMEQDDLQGPAKLMGIEFNAGRDLRLHRRINRTAAILYYALKANYTPTEMLARIVEVLSTLSAREQLLVQQALAELIRRKVA